MAILLQFLIVLKEKQILKRIDEEFQGLICFNILLEEKIVMISIICLGFLVTKNQTMINFFKFFIISIVLLQIINLFPRINIYSLIDYPLMIMEVITIIYLICLVLNKLIEFTLKFNRE